MTARWHVRMLAAGLLFGAPWSLARALQHPDDPIDPNKRASISTQDAVKPAATMPVGTGVIGDGKLPTERAPIQVVPTTTTRAPIVVTESKPKNVRRADSRGAGGTARRFKTTSAADSPASIPRLDARQFHRTLDDVRQGRKTAASLANQRVQVGSRTVDIGEINRFANPRATLEAQGIPVVPAGGEPPAESTEVTVPLTQKDTATR